MNALSREEIEKWHIWYKEFHRGDAAKQIGGEKSFFALCDMALQSLSPSPAEPTGYDAGYRAGLEVAAKVCDGYLGTAANAAALVLEIRALKEPK